MPAPKQDPYICPRCGYKTDLRFYMKRHLYEKKKPCFNKFDLVLTDEIKEVVINERIYHPSKNEGLSTSKIIQNYNTLNKFVIQLDISEKVNCLLDHKQLDLLDFEDELENRFEYRVNRLEKNKYPGGYLLQEDDLLKIVNDVTQINPDHINQFNVYYQKAIKQIQIFRTGGWESFMEDVGAKQIISLIKSYFFDKYEEYLIRNLHLDKVGTMNPFQITDHLKKYYSFIAAFDLIPYISDMEDKDLLGHRLKEDTNTYLSETYTKVYLEQKKGLKSSEKTRIIRKVISIVKHNTIHNISELNQIMLDMLNVDERFKNNLLEKIKGNGVSSTSLDHSN